MSDVPPDGSTAPPATAEGSVEKTSAPTNSTNQAGGACPSVFSFQPTQNAFTFSFTPTASSAQPTAAAGPPVTPFSLIPTTTTTTANTTACGNLPSPDVSPGATKEEQSSGANNASEKDTTAGKNEDTPVTALAKRRDGERKWVTKFIDPKHGVAPETTPQEDDQNFEERMKSSIPFYFKPTTTGTPPETGGKATTSTAPLLYTERKRTDEPKSENEPWLAAVSADQGAKQSTQGGSTATKDGPKAFQKLESYAKGTNTSVATPAFCFKLPTDESGIDAKAEAEKAMVEAAIQGVKPNFTRSLGQATTLVQHKATIAAIPTVWVNRHNQSLVLPMEGIVAALLLSTADDYDVAFCNKLYRTLQVCDLLVRKNVTVQFPPDIVADETWYQNPHEVVWSYGANEEELGEEKFLHSPHFQPPSTLPRVRMLRERARTTELFSVHGCSEYNQMYYERCFHLSVLSCWGSLPTNKLLPSVWGALSSMLRGAIAGNQKDVFRVLATYAKSNALISPTTRFRVDENLLEVISARLPSAQWTDQLEWPTVCGRTGSSPPHSASLRPIAPNSWFVNRGDLHLIELSEAHEESETSGCDFDSLCWNMFRRCVLTPAERQKRNPLMFDRNSGLYREEIEKARIPFRVHPKRHTDLAMQMISFCPSLKILQYFQKHLYPEAFAAAITRIMQDDSLHPSFSGDESLGLPTPFPTGAGFLLSEIYTRQETEGADKCSLLQSEEKTGHLVHWVRMVLRERQTQPKVVQGGFGFGFNGFNAAATFRYYLQSQHAQPSGKELPFPAHDPFWEINDDVMYFFTSLKKFGVFDDPKFARLVVTDVANDRQFQVVCAVIDALEKLDLLHHIQYDAVAFEKELVKRYRPKQPQPDESNDDGSISKSTAEGTEAEEEADPENELLFQVTYTLLRSLLRCRPTMVNRFKTLGLLPSGLPWGPATGSGDEPMGVGETFLHEFSGLIAWWPRVGRDTAVLPHSSIPLDGEFLAELQTDLVSRADPFAPGPFASADEVDSYYVAPIKYLCEELFDCSAEEVMGCKVGCEKKKIFPFVLLPATSSMAFGRPAPARPSPYSEALVLASLRYLKAKLEKASWTEQQSAAPNAPTPLSHLLTGSLPDKRPLPQLSLKVLDFLLNEVGVELSVHLRYDHNCGSRNFSGANLLHLAILSKSGQAFQMVVNAILRKEGGTQLLQIMKSESLRSSVPDNFGGKVEHNTTVIQLAMEGQVPEITRLLSSL